MQNESIELTDDPKGDRKFWVVFFFLTIFIAFEMAPKRNELSLLKVALNTIKEDK